MTAQIPLARIVSVRMDFDDSSKDIMTVVCPYCKETHKHRETVKVARDARCGAGQYMPADWEQPR